jgi:hypothetical protein
MKTSMIGRPEPKAIDGSIHAPLIDPDDRASGAAGLAKRSPSSYVWQGRRYRVVLTARFQIH